MLEYEGRISLYVDQELVGFLEKERQGPFWLLKGNLLEILNTDEASYADLTVEKTLAKIKAAARRMNLPGYDEELGDQ